MKRKFSKFSTNHIFNYRRLRRAIGYLGLFLPIILITFSFIPYFKTEVQASISHYYYTNLREIFTGTLSAVGLFLICYKGHKNPSIWKNDQVLTNIAGVMAVGIALVPVSPYFESQKIYSFIPYSYSWLGWVHYGFAAVLFGIFSLLALNVFTIGQNRSDNIPFSTINENNIYRFCGLAIIILLVLVPISANYKLFKYSTLILESLILLLFGIAWLIKGRALGDGGNLGEKLYREHNPERPEEME